MLELLLNMYKNILEERPMKTVNTDKMRYGFVSCRNTLDVVFVFRKLTEMCQSMGKKDVLCFCKRGKFFD